MRTVHIISIASVSSVVLAIVAAIVGHAARSPSTPPTADRFTLTYIDGTGLTVITDTKTGEEYLRYYNGGLVHLEKAPTPIPAPEKP